MKSRDMCDVWDDIRDNMWMTSTTALHKAYWLPCLNIRCMGMSNGILKKDSNFLPQYYSPIINLAYTTARQVISNSSVDLQSYFNKIYY